jgi:hypothetical protein
MKNNINRKWFDARLQFWGIPELYVNEMYNYLVLGFKPGSFFKGLLCNDAFDMISHSHISNRIETLKPLVNFLMSAGLEGVAFGSKEAYNSWLTMSSGDRKKHLEQVGLFLSEKNQTVFILRGSNYAEAEF